MPDLGDFQLVIDWIEEHQGSLDILKWLLVLLAAWALGLFKYVRRKLKSPRVEIERLTSRCYCEAFEELHDCKDVVRSVFLLHVSVTNPTTDPIVVKDFWLRYRTLRSWKKWTEFMLPTTLPNRPRQTVGSSTKLLKVWFSKYQDDPAEFALDGRIEARDYQAGYVLFVSSTWGNHNPRITNGKLALEVRAKLTTGETLRHRVAVSQLEDRAYLESFVPGILAVADDHNAQNLFTSRA
ncbi:hypothetical protein [Pseudoxanthomonas sp. Soil82]|uniref:hypothetical protein n=1 Tax=Pseudoxanthomonas sp. Soil82 TaxID=3157341 RepID=UPI00338D841D